MCTNNDENENRGSFGWLFRRSIESIDFFAKPMPQFQLKGRSRVPSLIGGIFALAILAIMALYALIKLNVLLNHENPNVSTFLDLFSIEQWEKLALPE